MGLTECRLNSGAYAFFHGPGESLQRHFIDGNADRSVSPTWFGFQHGLIGTSPPKGLQYVLAQSRLQSYISIERTFSDALRKYSKVEVVEYLQPQGIFEPIDPENGCVFAVFLDSPDTGDFWTCVKRCLNFLKTLIARYLKFISILLRVQLFGTEYPACSIDTIIQGPFRCGDFLEVKTEVRVCGVRGSGGNNNCELERTHGTQGAKAWQFCYYVGSSRFRNEENRR